MNFPKKEELKREVIMKVLALESHSALGVLVAKKQEWLPSRLQRKMALYLLSMNHHRYNGDNRLLLEPA